MRKIISLFLLFAFTIVFSQKTISGVVKNSDGEVVSSASITIEEKGKDAIVAYAISNAKGEYKITFNSQDPTVDMKVKAFNHKALVKNVSNVDHTENFSLQTEATEIKEVKLKAKMITAKGDTISYDLKAFANKSDRTLADVLKKMPGSTANLFIFINYLLRISVILKFFHLFNKRVWNFLSLNNEKLRAVCVRTAVCHRKSTVIISCIKIKFILKRSAPN